MRNSTTALGRHFKVGRLDRVVELRKPTYTKHPDYNTDVEGDPEVFRRWAHKMPMSGDETSISNQETNKKVVSWVIRFDGISPDATMVLIEEKTGIEHDVKDWEEVGRERFWILKTERKL